MISYEVYKILHVVSFILVFFVYGQLFFNYQNAGKSFKIVHGIFALLLFVSGMGLMARIGVSHTEGWPLWLKIKMGGYFVLMGLPMILLKRKVSPKIVSIISFTVLVILVYSVINKI